MSGRYDDAFRARACELRRAGKLGHEIASELGCSASTAYNLIRGATPGLRHHRWTVWREEWDARLGTDTDARVAVELGCSPTLVAARRLGLGIAPSGPARKARYATRLKAVSDLDLAVRPAEDIARELEIPVHVVGNERSRRGVRFRRSPDAADGLRRAAVAGMLAACNALGKATNDGTQSRIAEVLGVSRERARQLCDEVRAMLTDTEGA